MTVLQQGLERYLSAGQLDRLASVRVGIAGCGGLGSNCAMLLARSGIRRFTLADFDLVDASNLNRQFFFPSDVGQPKVEALGRRLLELDPELDLKLINGRLEAESLPQVYAGCDILVEALDKAEYKAIFCNLFMERDVFLVCASGLGGFGGAPMRSRKLGRNMVCVGDFSTEADEANPPLAPRVMQAAAMQADAVLARILG
ncbi:sulfur carrier protein ThiS adenylyltransferase ThiF [Desulfovibrio sp. OttesenSCG-928-C06]|nr:sulfur carrier protein ThiS adenylyltransferase ThiF [Desulfovibrio sp. OttesenSCG-928-C06]